MKKVILLLLLACQIPAYATNKMVRGARPFGFFSDYLLALNHLEYCKANNLTPVIYWGEISSYFLPEGYNGTTNVWEYYFEPVSEETCSPKDFLHGEIYYQRDNNFTAHTYYQEYIRNKYKLPIDEQKSFKPVDDTHEQIYLAMPKDTAHPEGAYHHYDTRFRKMVKEELIDPFIKIKPHIIKRIQTFYDDNMKGKKTVGIHLRGTHILNEVLPVPLEYIFNEANKYADQGYQFFIATDQYPLIEAAQKTLRGPVLFLEAERFQSTTSPFGTFKLHPKLGEDLLVEAYLLSMTDHFIHTLSNVSSAVLYFNPELPHTLIY